jgi:hypothetical protein
MPAASRGVADDRVRSHQRDRRTWVRDLGVCAALTVLTVTVYALLFLSVPALTETRDFLVHEGHGARSVDLLTPSGSDVRPFSWLLFAWQWRLFGFDVEAVNLFQFVLLALCGVAGYVHLRQLQVKSWAAAAAAAIWLLSLPALHAAFWQATQHDKLGALFSLTAMIVAMHAYRVHRAGFRVVLAALLTVLVLVAVASKPVAFVLAGALIAQALLLAPDRTGAGLRSAITVVAAPVLSALLYAVVYLGRMQPEWRAHTTGGSIPDNLLVYLRYVGNTDFDGAVWPPVLFFTPVVVAWTHAAWRTAHSALSRDRWKSRTGGRREAALVYLCLVFAGSVVILARARYPAPFYTLIPAFAFTGSLALVIESMISRVDRRRGASTLVAAGLVVGLLAAATVNLRGDSRLGRWRAHARNVADGYRVIEAAVSPEAVRSIVFVLPDDAGTFYYLFSDAAHTDIDPAIPSFIFRRPAPIPIRVIVSDTPPTSPTAGELVVIWSNDFHLSTIELSGQAVHQAARHRRSWAYRPGDAIDFKKGGNGSQYQGKGWSWPEEYGTWTDGDRADLILQLDQPPAGPLQLVLRGKAFVTPAWPRQDVTVLANDRQIGLWTFTGEPTGAQRSAAIPATLLDSRYLKLSLRIADPRSPLSAGLSADPRRLGILVHDVRLSPRDPALDQER